MLPFLLAASLLGSVPSDTVPVPHRHLAALEAGTRTRSGVPGPRYWQQQVRYHIRTRLLPEETRVTGSERITYTNRSPDTLTSIALNLPQNVFAPGNPRNRAVPVTGGFQLERIVVQGKEVTLTPRGASLSTSESVPLSRPLLPGEVAQLEISWSFIVPEGTFRMGREGKEVFFLAQWYPQIAVYDDLRGWIRDPYLGNGEFYLEYGDFDVEITAPAGWLVSATGVLANPGEVLAPPAVERLASLSRNRVTPIVSSADVAAGRATAPGGADGTLTWRFRAENVRDFAWGASNRYVWDGTLAEYPDVTGALRTSSIYTLYRPGRPNWERSAEFARHAIETHSTWYPYPYPHMTVNEGVIGGGMEYPMITIIGGGRTPESLYGVIAHEIAHMWWPMVAGSDERNHAWIDEGFASLAEDMATDLFFPGSNAGLATMNGYLRVAGSDDETPSMRPTDEVGPFGNRGTAAYGKPATVFRALRAILGPAVFDEAMRTYLRRWAYRHPTPLDLFWTFEDVAGEDLDWFFYPWLYTTRVLDQAVAAVERESGGAVVVLEDRGEIPMPAIVETVTESGERSRRIVPVTAWEGRRMRVRIPLEGRIVEVLLDPEERFPDVNRGNNRWVGAQPLPPPTPSSRPEAAARVVEGVDFRVYDGRGRDRSLAHLFKALDETDALLVGETHDDAVGHGVEAEIFMRAAERMGAAGGEKERARPIVLSLEMFERDVQYVVDEYLAGLITEDQFKKSSRPWERYDTDYRPMVEFARERGIPVVAANAPRRYVNRVSRLGPASLDPLPASAKAFLPPLPYPGPSEAYAAKWNALMAEMMAQMRPPAAPQPAPQGHGVGNALHAQALWDAAMGHAIAAALDARPGALVVHYVGSFHVEGGTGIPERIRDYRPRTRMVIVFLQPVEDIHAWNEREHRERGDFVILTRRPSGVAPGTRGGS